MTGKPLGAHHTVKWKLIDVCREVNEETDLKGAEKSMTNLEEIDGDVQGLQTC